MVAFVLPIVVPVFIVRAYSYQEAKKRHKARQKRDHPQRVTFSKEGVWEAGVYFPLTEMFLTLKDVHMTSQPTVLHFRRKRLIHNNYMRDTLRVLVPRDYEEEAVQLMERFCTEVIEAKKPTTYSPLNRFNVCLILMASVRSHLRHSLISTWIGKGCCICTIGYDFSIALSYHATVLKSLRRPDFDDVREACSLKWRDDPRWSSKNEPLLPASLHLHLILRDLRTPTVQPETICSDESPHSWCAEVAYPRNSAMPCRKIRYPCGDASL